MDLAESGHVVNHDELRARSSGWISLRSLSNSPSGASVTTKGGGDEEWGVGHGGHTGADTAEGVPFSFNGTSDDVASTRRYADVDVDVNLQ